MGGNTRHSDVITTVKVTPYRVTSIAASSLLMAVQAVTCFLMVLLACHQLAAGALQHAGLKEKPALRVQSETGTMLSEKEVLKELNEHRHRRAAAAAGSPVATSNFTFANEAHTSGIIQYSGGDSKVIFVLMYSLSGGSIPTSSKLYRSTNYGRTFTKSTLNSQLGSHILYHNIHVAPNNNKILVFRDSQHAQIYVTRDEGNTFTTRQLSPSTVDPGTMLFHPTLYTHFLIYDPTNYTLYVTTDLGQSLIKLSDNVPPRQYQWGVAPFDLATVVYYNVFDPDDIKRGDFTFHLYRQNVPGNYPVEFDPSLGKHDDFLIVGRYMFVQKTLSGLATLWVSYDRNPFLMAHIPSPIPHQNYYVESIKSLQALVIVQHTNGQHNLYLSEETGQHFSLSLPDLVIANNALDLELVDSMNATYIANQNIGSSIRTLISFDNGGNWQLLRPPALTSCQPPSCSLHLHMSSSQYWRTGVYSQQSAPGIIIAHGTTGASLSSDPDLYVSSDGGINWRQALQSSWGVTVLDHGGLIVAAKDYHQSDRSSVLKYSCDEGSTWRQFNYSNVAITIFGVITEPGETTTSVSLFGIEQFSHPEWEVIQINFTTVFTGLCQPTDYYWWHPWDERSSTECLLGNKVSIQRRKPSVCCLNSQQFSRVVNYTKCACVFEDFECDYGYMHHSNGFNGTCVRDTTITVPGYCQSGVTHDTLSKGYRKVGGDVCEGGSEVIYASTDTACCSNNPTTNPTNCPSCPFTHIPATCPPCSSSNTPPTSSIAGPATSATNVVAVVLAVLLVVTIVVIIALFTVSVVLVWKLMAKAGGGSGYQSVPRNERFVFRPHSPDRVQTNLAFQDDDDEAPLQP